VPHSIFFIVKQASIEKKLF